MASKLNKPKLSTVKFIKSFKVAGKTKETKLFINLVILENQNLCLTTNGHWYCSCQQMIPKFELKEGHVIFLFSLKKLENLFENCAQCFL